MKLKNVLLSTRRTALEYFQKERNNFKEVLPAADTSSIKNRHETHCRALSFVRKILDGMGINHKIVYMPDATFEDFAGKDLIITLGGDGTVLNTANFIRNSTPMLTIKSDAESSGVLCLSEPGNLKEKLERILNDDYSTEQWTRIEGRIGKKVNLALNEILIGPKYGAGAARYSIEYKKKKENQISSGVVVSTGAGSTGWYKNIAGSDGKFSRTSRELKFVVREPDKDREYIFRKGTIRDGETLKIKSLMNIDGAISFDGDTRRMIDFPRGAEIIIKRSNKPIHVII